MSETDWRHLFLDPSFHNIYGGSVLCRGHLQGGDCGVNYPPSPHKPIISGPWKGSVDEIQCRLQGMGSGKGSEDLGRAQPHPLWTVLVILNGIVK